METPDVMKGFEALTSTNEAMVALLSKSSEEIAKTGATSEATAKAIKEHGDNLIEIKGVLAESFEKLNTRLEAAEKAEAERIKERQRPHFDGGEDLLSAGAEFVKQFQGKDGQRLIENLQSKNVRNSQAIKIKGGFVAEIARAMQRKAVLATDSATRFAPVMREPMLPANRRRLHLRDLMTVVQTDQNSGEYVEELGFSPAATTSVTGITQSGGTATLAKAGHGFRVGQRLKVSGASQAGYNLIGARVLSVPSSSTLTYAVDSGTVSPATGTIVMQNLSVGAAAGTAEGDEKPEAQFHFELKNWNIRTIAEWIAVSRQALSDVAGLQSFIDNRLIYDVLREEDRQLVYGPGTGQTLQGIYTHPNVQTLVGVGKKLDVIRRSITLVELAEMEADGVMLSPEDKEAIDIAKGDDGHYIWMQPTSMQKVVWQLPVISSTVIEPGDFVTGAWGSGGATLYDREEAQVLLSYDHDDFFVKNLLALLGEERVGVAWHRPEAFVAGDFGTAV